MKDIESSEAEREAASVTGPDKGQGQVKITIDGNVIRIRQGQHRVSELKELGNVPAEYVLEQIINGVLTPLKDDAKVHIRGGEVFSSHPGSGGAA